MKRMNWIAEDASRGLTEADQSVVAWTIGKRVAALIVALVCISAELYAGAAPRSENSQKAAAASPQPLAELQRSGALAAQYCEAARDAIAEARHAHQAAQLERLAKAADDRLALIEKSSAELKDWIEKRDSFIASATKHLVSIFGSMRPEAASEQLVRLDVSTAASILSQLDARAASAILNDMPPEKAARLAAVIAGSARKDSQEKR